MSGGGRCRFYITRPDMLTVSQIAEHIQSDNRARESRDYHIIFVPRKLSACDYILEREGIYGFIKILEWNSLHLFTLDEHLLSLELHSSLRTLYVDCDYTMLHSIAQSVLLMEDIYGTIPVVHGKGHMADKVWQLIKRLKELKKTTYNPREGGAAISELVLFDRQCDLVTPVCSQLTYEGILDDVFKIKSGYVEFGKEVTGKDQNTKVLLNAADPVYNEIRSLHFSSVPPVLSDISRQLQSTYTEARGTQSIPELKSFVKRLPELRKRHDSLAIHLKVSEQIVIRKRQADFQKQLFFERAVLEAVDKVPITDYIEECIHRQVNYRIPLRLMCLMSVTNNGIKSKYLAPLKHQYLHSYSHKYLVVFDRLQRIGFIQEKGEESSQVSRPLSTFKQLSKQLKLVPKDPGAYALSEPKDMSYVYGGAYKPLSCAAVDHVVRTGSWKGLDDIVKIWSGPVFTHFQSARRANGHRVVLVFFIGGCTFSEINALRFWGEKTNCHYIIATTNIISPDSVINVLAAED